MPATAESALKSDSSCPARDLGGARAKINELLKIPGDWDPSSQLDGNWKKMVRTAVEEYRQAVQEKAAEAGWSPDQALIAQARQFVGNPVFISGYMKSGTTLLTQMLDGHPQCHVILADIDFVIKSQANDSMDNLREEILQHWFYRMIVSATPSWYYDNDTDYVDFVRYFRFLSAEVSGRKAMLEALVMALYCANPKRSEKVIFWVAKTPGMMGGVDEILKIFPSARFIHPIRAPFPNLAALKRQAAKRKWEWSLRGYAFTLRDVIKDAYRNEQQLGKNRYHLFYYDKLVANPEEEAGMLAAFLGIDWNPSLLTPTSNSKPATSNTMFKENKVTGVILNRAGDQWRKQLTDEEFWAASTILYPLLARKGLFCHATFPDFVKGVPGHIRFRFASLAGKLRKTFSRTQAVA